MKIITVEEHYNSPEIMKLTMPYMQQVAPFYADALQQLQTMKPPHNLETLGAARIADMDKHGIDMQVVSNTNMPQLLPADKQVPLVQEMNSILAAEIKPYPTRYRALGMLPWGDSRAAAAELKRCVTEYGFVGAMLPGRPMSEAVFADDHRFDEIWAMAQELRVPVYVHPGPPVKQVQEAYYAGFNPAVTGALSVFAWGWHAEAGIQVLRMILGGVFERFPQLQVLSGHWGEMVPFFLSRLDRMLPVESTGLSNTISNIYRKNVYVTPSGMYSNNQFTFIINELGAQRIIFSVDYPYIMMDGARDFLQNAPLSSADRELVAHGNAEKLFNIS